MFKSGSDTCNQRYLTARLLKAPLSCSSVSESRISLRLGCWLVWQPSGRECSTGMLSEREHLLSGRDAAVSSRILSLSCVSAVCENADTFDRQIGR